MANQWYVYDTTYLEWNHRQKLKHEGKCYLVMPKPPQVKPKAGTSSKESVKKVPYIPPPPLLPNQKQPPSINKPIKYEVICKRELLYILVLYTSESLDDATRLYNSCLNVVNAIDHSVPFNEKELVVGIYQEVMRHIR